MFSHETEKGEIVKLKIPSRPVFLKKTRTVLDEICNRAGFAEKKTLELKLAINEALANIIEHAYANDPDKFIYLYFLIVPDRLEVIIRDFGDKPDPTKLRHRDLGDLEDRGLGIFFMKNFVDYMTYDFSNEVGTQLKFIKYKEKPKQSLVDSVYN